MFSRRELETAHFSVRVAQAHTRLEHPFRPTLDELLRRIETELSNALHSCASETEVVAVLENWVTTAEAAKRLGCSPQWVRKRAEELGGRKHGRDWQIPEEALL
jgi:hypothetical protein